MHQFLIVNENDKGRRFHRCLGDIIEAKTLSLIGRRLLHRYSLGHYFIEHAGGNTQRMVFDYRINGFKQLGKALSGHCRYEKNLRIRHEGKCVPHLFLETVDRFIILFNGVPFIYRDNHTFAPFMGNSCNLGILLGNAFLGIDDEDHHVGTFHRPHGTDDHITLQFFFDFIFPAKSRRINEDVFPADMNHFRIDGVSGHSRDIGYDHPVFSA